MTAEEAIVLIGQAAAGLPVADIDVFLEKAREDIAIYRREAPLPHFERRDDPDIRYPEPRREFVIPERYRNQPELWLVFSAFVEAFLDPVTQAVEVARAFEDLPGEPVLERAVFASEFGDEIDFDAFEFFDRKRLEIDLRELLELSTEIGHLLFEQYFSLDDFFGAESQYEQR